MPHVGEEGKFAWREESPLQPRVAFAAIAIFIIVLVLCRASVREASTGLSLITAVMIMLILRNAKIDSRRRIARSKTIAKEIEALELTIRSLGQSTKSLPIEQFLVSQRQSHLGDEGAKWDVRPNR